MLPHTTINFCIRILCDLAKLQDLLNHTASRLCKILVNLFEITDTQEPFNVELILKWGCDGSRQAKLQQLFQNAQCGDPNIFQSSIVPIRLQSLGDSKKILWQNPTQSSPRFFHPIRVQFVHETVDITKEEIKYEELTRTQIKNKMEL